MLGRNANGELGDNSATDRPTPVDVTGLTGDITAIAAGGFHTCALTAAGGVKCWGGNSDGQLGDNSATKRLTPIDVVGLTSGVAAIAAGYLHTCALTTSGGTRCWGYNYYGQLGDNSRTDRNVPVDVIGLTAAETTPSATAPISDERLFAFAEANYPSIFAGTPAAGQTLYQGKQFNYRYYPLSGNYLAIDNNGEISVLGPYTGGALAAVGPVETFRSYIVAWEAAK